MPKDRILAGRPSFMLEQEYDGPVCGIDEVGRGPLAGPVTACCVFIPQEMRSHQFLAAINDSKKLTAKRRDALFEQITDLCFWGLGEASPGEIDALNIHHATLLAMKRAWDDMRGRYDVTPRLALVDGRFAPEIDCSCKPVTKGDSISLSIAAASIVAKVTRDRLMARLHTEFPVYGWAKNAGYGTAEHLSGLRAHGVTPYHRRSFSPVREALAA